MVAGYGMVMAVLWTPPPAQRPLFWAAFFGNLLLLLLRREDWSSLGLGGKGLLRSLWVVGAALVVALFAVWVALRLHTLHALTNRRPWQWHIWGYVLWALMQQVLLQGLVFLRLRRMIGRDNLAVLAAALLFALAHLPNPVLTALTFLWGLAACALFLRYRNLYTLGMAHAILGLCVALTVPDAVLHHMRVGTGYLRYCPRSSQQSAPYRVHTGMGDR
jgi:membrane protease YdiL (CAAX protease family)